MHVVNKTARKRNAKGIEARTRIKTLGEAMC